MKISIFLFTSLLMAQLVNAQPDLNTFAAPTIGDKVKQTYFFDDAVPAEGSSGADQTWDFSTVNVSSGTATTVTLTNPSQTAYASDYPAATVAEVSAGGGITYGLYNTTEKTLLGTVSTGRKEIYSNTYKYAVTPFAYNTSQTDDFAYSFLYANTYPVTATGTVKTTYDGYGTLITPAGTFTNVIRLKAEVTETDVVQYTSSYTVTTTNVGVVYTWIQADKYFSLFSVSTNTSTTSGFESTGKQAILYEPLATTTGIEESLSAKINITPNPATDLVSLDVSSITQENYEVSVYNATGILEYKNTFEKGNATIDISGFASGLYIMNIITAQGKMTKNFVKN